MSTLVERYGPVAAVLGAAEGIGEAFARRLAAEGFGLVLVDRDADRLAATAGRLRAGHDGAVDEVVADLSQPPGVQAAADVAARDGVGLVVHNAALSYVGTFAEQPLEQALAQLDVNCRAPLVVTHWALEVMRGKGRGALILLSSMSAMRGAPLVATYAATKAFLLVLAEGLWAEERHHGIDVLAVLPGSTRTPGMLASSPAQDPATMSAPEDVVDEALAALGRQPSVIVGEDHREGDAALAAMDRRSAVDLMDQVMRQMYPDVS